MAENKKPAIRFKGFTDAWEQRELGEIATEIIAGGDVDKSLLCEEGNCPVIANALTNGGIIGYYKNEYRVKAPAVTVTGRGDVGHAKARNDDFTPVVRLLSVKSEHDIYFLENAINAIKIVVESTGVSQLTVPQLSKNVVFYPNSAEEEMKIGTYFRNLDTLITLHQRKYDKLVKVKKSMLEKMFPKNGSKFPEIRFNGFTDAWEQREFGNIAQRISDTAVSCNELPYVEYEDVISNQGVLNRDVYAKEGEKTGVVFSEDNVLYGKLRPYLHNWLNPDFKGVAVGDWWVLKPINADKNFLYQLIQSENFDNISNQSTGTKMPRADWKLVSATEFCIPKSLDEQALIGQYFKNLDTLITLHQRVALVCCKYPTLIFYNSVSISMLHKNKWKQKRFTAIKKYISCYI